VLRQYLSWCGAFLSVAFLVGLSSVALAQQGDYLASSGDYGGVGLLQTRTARFSPDGTLEVGYEQIFPYERYLITIQAFPWLEGTFRYTSVNNRDFAGNTFTGQGTSFKDRGADIKILLKKESQFWPQIAVGLQDGLGTGLFGGEFLALSKRYYDFDFSIGLGWGYNAGAGKIRNPLISLSDSFQSRTTSGAPGGTFRPGTFFSGPFVGVFGGVEYFTPVSGVSLKLEFDPNDYTNDALRNTLDATTHLNFGVNWRVFPWMNLGLGYERGTTAMFRLSLVANLDDKGIPKFDPPPPPLTLRPPNEIAPAEPAVSESSAGVLSRVPRKRQSKDVADVLMADGISVGELYYAGSDLVVSLAESPLVPPLSIAALAAAYSHIEVDAVVVLEPGGRVSVYQSEQLQPVLALIVLETELAREGIGLEAVSLSGDAAILDVDLAPDQEATKRLATSIKNTIPFLTSVRFLGPGGGADFVDVRLNELANAPTEVVGAKPANTVAHAGNSDNYLKIAAEIFNALDGQGIAVSAVDINEQRLSVYVQGGPYRQLARVIGRTARISANLAPANVEEIEVISSTLGSELSRTILRRRDLERASALQGSSDEIWMGAEIKGPQYGKPRTLIENPDAYPDYRYSFAPSLRQHIGSGDGFYLYQVYARLTVEAEPIPGLVFSGTVGKDLYNNFNRLTTESDSQLPKVRSDIKAYLQQGEDSLIRLQAYKVWSPAPDLYARISAGIFEEMYGGYSGEILYRPFGARIAAGVDLNYVRQRDFDQRLTFRDYSITTGHLNLYYAFPYKNLLGQMHIGRYLAGDLGATFQLSRLFESGIRAGAFLTFTDVPFDVFGEGSFDKGFFLTIPFDLFSTRSSTNVGLFGFRPLTRDGGQRVSVSPRLYDITAGGNLDAITRDWARLLD
jgi:hypothetical protein